MRHTGTYSFGKYEQIRGWVAALAVAMAFGLVGASPSQAATFETVDHFGGVLTAPSDPSQFPEEVQLDGVSDLAVNRTGAGGVAPGTIYAIGRDGDQNFRVSRFAPDGTFEEVWDSAGKRCGPATAANPAEPDNYVHCPVGINHAQSNLGVDIDQATGNVYVLFNEFNSPTVLGGPTVRVYNPDGSTLIGKIGERDPAGTIAESPSKFHSRASMSGIAVNDDGEVYIFDEDETFNYRVMLFRPETPGDFQHYVYAGQSNDIAPRPAPRVASPILDDAGNLYGLEGDSGILEYDPSEPASPICSFELSAGGISAFTINPASGEAFYYSYKKRNIHQLACDATGTFVEKSVFGITPLRGELEAMVVDPDRTYGPGRPQGVLYGATYKSIPSTGSGGEPNSGPLGYVLAGAVENPPQVVSESVANVTVTSATLQAQINPKGSPTRYVFQYLPLSAYEGNEITDRFAGASEAPAGGADLGTGQSPLSAAVALLNLPADTEYRYRVIARSNCSPSEPERICETAGAAEDFHTYPVEKPGLSDARAWELVSPAQKSGGEVIPTDPSRASCGSECKPGVVSSHFPQQSAPDGDAVVYMGTPFAFDGVPGPFSEYHSKRTSAGWQTTSLSPAQMGPGSRQGPATFDPSLDSSLLYQVFPSLGTEAPTNYANLYRQKTAAPMAFSPLLGTAPVNRSSGVETNSFVINYAGASADLSRVFFEANDALTAATPSAPAAVDGGRAANNLYEWSEDGLRLVNVFPGNGTTQPGATFGGRQKDQTVAQSLFHAVSADGSRAYWSDVGGQVYVRENGEATREIPDHAGRFLSASEDGSKVLLDDGHLIEVAPGEAEIDLTQGKGEFSGIAGQSEDLSTIYFVDTAVIDGTPNEHGDVAVEGENNLYLWREGSTSFIATLPTPEATTASLTWATSPTQRSAQASPSGRWLAFLSYGRPTGYDNTGAPGACRIGFNGNVCAEIFLFDSDSGRLRCASCNPSGSAPQGQSELPHFSQTALTLRQPHYLTDAGRLYFDSHDSLNLGDTNEGLEDVYQYEPQGSGTCGRVEGCVSLISSGHGSQDSNLLDVDATGKNVFFTSRDQLTLKDKDELIDLYDAREGGGIAAETETARSECQGEACQAPVSAPNDPTPSSSSFQGAGNVNEAKAKKKHAKKHKKKRHAKKKHASKRAAKHNRGGAK